MKKLLFCAVPIFFTGFVSAAQFIQSSDADLNSQSAQLLAKDLGAFVKTLPSEKYMYTYGRISLSANNSEYKSSEARSQYTQNRTRSLAQMFWSLKPESSQFHMGSGLYLAIDPLISSDLSPVSANRFGLDVTEVKLPANTKYFSVASPIKLSQSTLDALVSEGYLSYSDLVLFNYSKQGVLKATHVISRDVFKNYTQAPYLKFKKLMLKIFASQKILAIEYNWNSSLDYFCKNAKKVAWILIGYQASIEKLDNPTFEGVGLTSVFDETVQKQTADEITTQNRIVKFRTILDDLTRVGSQISAQAYLEKENSSQINLLRNVTYSCQ